MKKRGREREAEFFMLARVRTPSSTVRERESEREREKEGGREKEGEIEKEGERERERGRESERERKRERCTIWLFLFLKGMMGGLGTF